MIYELSYMIEMITNIRKSVICFSYMIIVTLYDQ